MRIVYKLALGVLALGAAIAGIMHVMTADQTRSVLVPALPVPVVTALVQQRDEPIILTGLGAVQALNTATIHSQVTGLLEEVEFTEGQLVKRGDILARIDPRLYEATLAQYQGQLAKDTALHAQAQADLQRYQALGREDSIALQQVQDQKLLVEQDAGLMQSDQGLVDGAKTQLDFTTLRAPFDGVTGIRLLDVGNIIYPPRSSTTSTQPNADSNAVVVITQIQPISVVFTLATKDIPSVQAALARSKPLQAIVYDQSGAKQLDVGTLLLINNQADTSSGTVQLKANFPNAQRQLWPGVFVNVELVTSVVHNALTVPTDALQQNDHGQFVFVVGADNKVAVRQVEVAQRQHAVALISKGLKAGEPVVVQGQYRLTPGVPVAEAPASEVANKTTASSGMLP
jgi:membrane fusion protein, multidrug efflux system